MRSLPLSEHVVTLSGNYFVTSSHRHEANNRLNAKPVNPGKTSRGRSAVYWLNTVFCSSLDGNSEARAIRAEIRKTTPHTLS